MPKTNEILNARGPKYGPMTVQFDLSQNLKRAIQNGLQRRTAVYQQARQAPIAIPPHHVEALEMIALKMSRAIMGDPQHEDNWDDIAGYATLIADDIRKMKTSTKDTYDE